MNDDELDDFPISLALAYERIEAGHEGDAATKAIACIEEHLYDRGYHFVNAFLAYAKPERLQVLVTLGVLTATAWGKGKLRERAAFVARAGSYLRERIGDEHAETLLQPLR